MKGAIGSEDLGARARGLCPACRFVTVVRSGKGSTFLLCSLAKSDPRFRKYPPQPVIACPGYAT